MMRLREGLALIILAALVSSAAAVTLERVEPDEVARGIPLEPEARFTSLLSEARKVMMDSASTLGSVEQQPVDSPNGAEEHSVASKQLSAALAQLQSSLDQLKSVHDEVARSQSLPSDVKAQVLWNIDRMMADSQRLRDAELAPYAREAIVKALRLRFGVMLTPSFWREAVDRRLLEGH